MPQIDPHEEEEQIGWKKKKEIVKPAIDIGQISPKGEVPIEFNQKFIIPSDIDLVDYSTVFDVSVRAGLDDSIISG